jgi:VWFA-related protein
MKFALTIALLGATSAVAQTTETMPAPPPVQELVNQSSITVNSTLVLVPALVKTKSGELVFTLTADDFLLTDDGIPQALRLEQDTGDQPLALVVCVETGGDGVAHLDNYRDLGTMLDALIGNVPHQVAVVGFDSTPTLLHGFTPNTNFIAHSLNELDPGDQGNATLDALEFSVDLLRKQPPTYRRAILLLGETIDHGSHTSMDEALRAIGDTNTIIYSVGFSSTRGAIAKEASKFSSSEPGPQHGCFTRDKDDDGNTIVPTDSAGRPVSRATQNYDCVAELLPPLRLAKMAEIAAVNALRRNATESVAHLTGGEFYKFKDAKSLDRDLLTISNHVPNRYVLSFRPQNPHPGAHALSLTLKSYPQLTVEARSSYWVEGAGLPPK